MTRTRWISSWLFLLVLHGTAVSLRADSADDQYTVAARHYSRGRWQLAADEFTTFREQYPGEARCDQVTFFLGEALVQLGRFEEARRQFETYVREAPAGEHRGQALFRRGEMSFLLGDTEAARADLQGFLKEHAGHALSAYALGYVGHLELAAGRAAAAQRRFEACLQRYPAGPYADECRLGLARAMESTGDVDGALRFYQFLADKADCALRDEAQLQQTILLHQAGRHEAAVGAARTLLQRTSDDAIAAHAAYRLGLSQLEAGQPAEAADTLSNSSQRYASHRLAPAMRFAAGQAWRRAGDRVAAARQYEQVVQHWPDSRWADDSLQLLVQLAWQQDDLERAERLAGEFNERYAGSPLRWIVQQTLGRARLKRGDYQGALQALQPLVQTDGEDGASDREPSGGGEDETGEANALDRVRQEAARQSIQARVDPANWYYLALAQLGLQQPGAALQSLERLPPLEADAPLHDGVLVARAAALVALQRFGEAIEPLKRYLEAQPQGPDAAKCRAQLAVALATDKRWGEAQQAISQLRQLHRQDPLYWPTVQYLAEAAYQDQRLELAESMFRELAAEGNPPERVARGLSGLAWLQWESDPTSAAAITAFERLIAQFPASPLAAEAAMVRGHALQEQGRLEAALAMYHLVLDRHADSEQAPAALLTAARLHEALQQQAEAERLLRRLQQQHPEYRPDAVLYQLAWVLVALDRPADADALFERLHQSRQHSKFWPDSTYRLAERALEAGRLADADRLAEAIVEHVPQHRLAPYAQYLRGHIAAQQRRWSDAVRCLTQLDPSPGGDDALGWTARYWLAEAYYRLGEYERAGATFDRLHADATERAEPWLAMTMLRRAQVRAQQRQWDEAAEIASRIAAEHPDFERQYEADYVLGRCHVSRAEFDAARAAYQRVIDSGPGRKTETAAMAQWMIGETHFLQKQYDRAIRAYHRVESLYAYPRWQAAALLQAGKCHEMVGRWSAAMDLYSQIVKEYSETDFANQASQRLRVARQRAAISRTR